MPKPREAMRRRRKQLGYTQETMADALGVAVNTYREWERGIATPRVGFRPRIAKRFEASLLEVDRWIDNSDDGAMTPNGVAVPRWLGHFAALEQGARELWSFEPFVVPGLLQTAAYATAVERRGPEPVGEAELAKLVELRMARQEVLERRPLPLQLSVVIDESVLYRVAGNREVMAEQLDHLSDTAMRPNVDLRILSFEADTFSASFGTFFVLFSSDSAEPYMSCVFDRGGPHYLDRPHEVENHERLFRYMTTMALSRDESVDFIRAVTKERYR